MWIIPVALHLIDKPVFSRYLPPVRFFMSLFVYLVFRQQTIGCSFFASLFVLFSKSVFQGGKRRREPHRSWSHSLFSHTLLTFHLIARTRVLHLGGLFSSLMYYMNEDHRSYNYTQLLQLRKESLKKIQACAGFEPLTSAIPVQHSDVC